MISRSSALDADELEKLLDGGADEDVKDDDFDLTAALEKPPLWNAATSGLSGSTASCAATPLLPTM